MSTLILLAQKCLWVCPKSLLFWFDEEPHTHHKHEGQDELPLWELPSI